ncbi:hypothetical protein B0T10DRAFT_37036 [Thelonectria olida]|uniref:Uncharacterized protein n=1 Tax=Thelonectria olida TaxID=1576542 RepID=A0A9P8WJU3_9HYPO|nr:hypothetical protein B0T10DRAFT_37036 [Thelonectria olida]
MAKPQLPIWGARVVVKFQGPNRSTDLLQLQARGACGVQCHARKSSRSSTSSAKCQMPNASAAVHPTPDCFSWSSTLTLFSNVKLHTHCCAKAPGTDLTVTREQIHPTMHRPQSCVPSFPPERRKPRIPKAALPRFCIRRPDHDGEICKHTCARKLLCLLIRIRTSGQRGTQTRRRGEQRPRGKPTAVTHDCASQWLLDRPTDSSGSSFPTSPEPDWAGSG